MGHTKRGEYAAYPSEWISHMHRDGNILKHEDNHHEEATGHEVQQKRHYLGIGIRLKQESRHICERYDRRRVQKKKDPGAFIAHIEHAHQKNDQKAWHISHQDVESKI